jgi:hypothetical protein
MGGTSSITRLPSFAVVRCTLSAAAVVDTAAQKQPNISRVRKRMLTPVSIGLSPITR